MTNDGRMAIGLYGGPGDPVGARGGRRKKSGSSPLRVMSRPSGVRYFPMVIFTPPGGGGGGAGGGDSTGCERLAAAAMGPKVSGDGSVILEGVLSEMGSQIPSKRNQRKREFSALTSSLGKDGG